MNIEVTLLEKQKLCAKVNGHKIISDQLPSAGGDGEMPEPFDYFMTSLPLCAAFYIRSFCNSRDIPTDGITIYQSNEKLEEKYKQLIKIEVKLPENFPKKYRKAVIKAAEGCTVKKVIQAGPQFEINIK